MIHWRRERKKQREFEKEALSHFDSLYHTAQRLTRSSWEAEDLVQETYLKAYRSFDRFQKGTNCRAWLFKILMNTFINLYQKKKTREAADETGALEDLYIFKRFEEELPGHGEVMGENLLKKVMSDDVLMALDQLPEDFRTVILLSDLQSLSYQEIADILGCSLGTVKSRLFRGRRLLQKWLYHYAVEHRITAKKKNDL